MDYGLQTVKGNTPSKSNCYRIINSGQHASLCKTDALERYEESFYMQVGKYRNLGIDSLFEFHVRVYYPSMRSDLDNSLKCLLDCLQHTRTITNDNRCIKVVAEKFIDKADPRVEFRIVTVE